MGGLLPFLKGLLRLRIRGRGEAFLSAAARDGVEFHHVVRCGEELEAWVSRRDFARLRGPARAARVRVRIRQRWGLPFWWRRARSRRMMWVGGAVFLLALWVAGSLVWTVRVEGAPTSLLPRVRAAAAAAGLRPGVWRGGVDRRVVERALAVRVPQVAWVGVELSGTTAVVRVAPRLAVAPQLLSATVPCNLVASTDARITGLQVWSGLARVRPGEEVRRGQVLVGGNLGAGPEGVSLLVHARGRVWGIVRRVAYRQVALRRGRTLPTGRRVLRAALRWPGGGIRLWGWGKIPFKSYARRRAGWRIPLLPVEFTNDTYAQTAVRPRVLTPAAALERARAAALSAARAELPVGAKVVDTRIETVDGRPAYMGVRVIEEAEEQIAKESAIGGGAGGEPDAAGGATR